MRMKNRIHRLFENKKENILSIYFTAGYPAIDDTIKILGYLADAGVDMVEIGIPFSDPLADGPVIQQTSQQAIANGMTLSRLLEQLQGFREAFSLPVLLMGYLNPVLQFGEERFLEACARTGIDGLIIPDLPLDYYQSHWAASCQRLQLSNILLITPQSTTARIQQLDQVSDGFIYMVASNSITGANRADEEQQAYFRRVQSLGLRNPTLVGFGIDSRQRFAAACRYSQGAIVGTAFLQHIQEKGVSKASVRAFVEQLRP